MTGEEGGEENCHPLITSLLNEGAVIKNDNIVNTVSAIHDVSVAAEYPFLEFNLGSHDLPSDEPLPHILQSLLSSM